MPKLKLSITAAIIALITISIALTLTTYAAITAPPTEIPSLGTIVTSANLGVYSNSLCTTNLTTINWGNLSPGDNINRTIYIKNTGKGLSLDLDMVTSKWTPTNANGPIYLTWNKQDTKLNPDESIAATLTLHVSPTIVDITNFNMQITITGTNQN